MVSSSPVLRPGPRRAARRRASSSSRASRIRVPPPASATASWRGSRRSVPPPTPLSKRGPSSGSRAPREASSASSAASRGRRRHRSRRPQAAERVACRARGDAGRKNGELVRFELAGARAFWCGKRPRHGASRQSAGPAGDEPDRHPCSRHPRYLPRGRAQRGRNCGRARSEAAGRSAASPLRHHRSVRRPRPRRCGLGGARPGSRQQRRLGSDGGHRRRHLLCSARKRSRQGSAGPGQLRLFPRSRGADATGADLQRPLLSCKRKRRGPASRCAWCSTRTDKEAPPVLARPDALGRGARLCASAKRHDGKSDADRPPARARAEDPMGGLCKPPPWRAINGAPRSRSPRGGDPARRGGTRPASSPLPVSTPIG